MLNKTVKFAYLLFCSVILFAVFTLFSEFKTKKNSDYEMYGKPNSPYSLQMYNSIEKYSNQYKIPKHVAYNVAYCESGYRGPFHWSYQPVHISNMGAVGPMQIIPMYAHKYAGKRVTANELMKMLRAWYNIHGNWTDACGAYNSGQPIHNAYAIFCSSNKNYKINWISY
jgi:soluble lytic murein transglycosylase-like protein